MQTASRTSGCLSPIKPHRRSSAWSPVGELTPARAARIHAIARGACGCLHPNIAEADRTFYNQRGAVLRIPAPCTASVSPSRTTIPPAIASTYAIGIPDYSDVEISAVSFVTTIDDFVGVTEPNRRSRIYQEKARTVVMLCTIVVHHQCVTAVTYIYDFAHRGSCKTLPHSPRHENGHRGPLPLPHHGIRISSHGAEHSRGTYLPKLRAYGRATRP